MKFSHLAGFVATGSSFARAQNGSFVSYSDQGIELDIKLAIKEASAAPFPLLVTFTAPVAVGWAGFATGGCMLRSPLIVAWPNNSTVMATTRWATFVLPPPSFPFQSFQVFFSPLPPPPDRY